MGRASESQAPLGRLILCPDMDRLSADALLWHTPDPGRDDRVIRAVRAAVAEVLTARQRRVVEAHFFEGVSQCELARRLGVSQQVIHKCLYGTRRNGRVVGGALKKLRARLQPLFDQP